MLLIISFPLKTSERSKALRSWSLSYLGRKSWAWISGRDGLGASFCFA
ncbi:hypothetical protein HMPREF9104_00514 [Lentilactobacillus kisonensis F0435]|uniref:Uncharacterized protein n=1 Tax=Lentilactobacillus kisonensis F0435 TaxID=797516 RepID=H1LD51_9LACO|nr:hypothetical protein HMPREF9104_00514 [Lentilactobacillus kisonensis F0435]